MFIKENVELLKKGFQVKVESRHVKTILKELNENDYITIPLLEYTYIKRKDLE